MTNEETKMPVETLKWSLSGFLALCVAGLGCVPPSSYPPAATYPGAAAQAAARNGATADPCGDYGGAGYGGDAYGSYSDQDYDDEGYDETITYAEAAPTPTSPQQPIVVTVSIADTLIGIKSNHKPWDGPGSIDPSAIQSLQGVLMSVGTPGVFAAAAAEVAKIANSGFDAPDVFGSVEVYSSASHHEVALPLVKDTYSPTWRSVFIRNVPIAPSTRIRITLWDKDAINDDPIGAYELNADDLTRFQSEARIVHQQVADAANQQWLFVGVSVMPQ